MKQEIINPMVPSISQNSLNPNLWKKFWRFLKKDSWVSFIIILILAYVLLKLVFFPLLSFITASPLPLVIVESCSMNHEGLFNFKNWWSSQGKWYTDRNISKEQFEKFSFKNGIKMGDIIFVWNRGEVNIGDTLIFRSNTKNPIIHRVVSLEPLGTKGDHNSAQLRMDNNPSGTDETQIQKEQIIGKAVFKIPRLGWVKLIFVKIYELARGTPQNEWC